MRQVREAIGVTLSVLCSNLRLSAASVHSSPEKVEEEGGLMVGLLQKKDWAKLLTEGVSELAMNILSRNHSDSMEITGELTHENVSVNKEVKADIRRMETVLKFFFFLSKIDTICQGQSY